MSLCFANEEIKQDIPAGLSEELRVKIGAPSTALVVLLACQCVETRQVIDDLRRAIGVEKWNSGSWDRSTTNLNAFSERDEVLAHVPQDCDRICIFGCFSHKTFNLRMLTTLVPAMIK